LAGICCIPAAGGRDIKPSSIKGRIAAIVITARLQVDYFAVAPVSEMIAPDIAIAEAMD
jgi:hypothetical protein